MAEIREAISKFKGCFFGFKESMLSNQIIFIGLRSSKNYFKRPGGGVGIWEGSLGCEFLLRWMCAEGMGCGGRWA